MILFQLIHLVAIIAAVFLGFFVLLNNQQRAVNIFFFILSLVMTGWLIALAAAFYTTNLPAAAVAIRIASALGAIAPFAFSMMRRSIMHPTVRWTTICASARIEALAPAAITVLVSTPVYLKEAVSSQANLISSLPEPVYGPGVLLYALYFAFYFVYLAISFSRDIRVSMGIQRTEIQFLLLGSLSGIFIGVLFSVVTPLVTDTSQSVQFAPVSAFFLEGIIAYGIATRRIMAVGDVLRRLTAYALLGAYLTGIYLAVWFAIQWALTPLLKDDLIPHLLATLSIAFSMAPAHGRMQRFANRLFLNVEPMDVTKTLQTSNRIINSIGTRTELLEQFAELTSTSVGTDRIMILLAEDQHLIQRYPPVEDDKCVRFDLRDPLPQTLIGTKAPLDVDALQRYRPSSDELRAGKAITSLKCIIAIGIHAGTELAGMVLLGPRLSGRIYGQTEQHALQLLCNQLAMGLENADLYTQIKDGAIYNDILLDSVVTGIIAANQDGRITVCNREAHRILHRASSIVHQHIEQLPPVLAQALRETIRTATGRRNIEATVAVSRGDDRPIRFSTALFHSHTGDPLGALLVLEDLTAIRKLENQVRRTDRLASIGTLSAGMAHEIKNPLVTLKTFTQLLPERYEDQDFRDTFSSLVGKEVTRIDSIVNQLLRFARPAKPSLRPTHLHEVVNNTLQLVEQQLKQRNIALSCSYQAKHDLINGDPNLLIQAFLNFFLNAIDSMEHGGTLTIVTHIPDAETNPLSLLEGLSTEPRIGIKISDTGCGIRMEDIPHIFDPFFTTKSSGTGLGLSVSHGIIVEHSGGIDVDSEVAKGTTFAFTFPLAKREDAA